MIPYCKKSNSTTIAKIRYPSYLMRVAPPVVYDDEDVLNMLVPHKFEIVKCKSEHSCNHGYNVPSLTQTCAELADADQTGNDFCESETENVRPNAGDAKIVSVFQQTDGFNVTGARTVDHRQENLKRQTSSNVYHTGVVDDTQDENGRTTPTEIYKHGIVQHESASPSDDSEVTSAQYKAISFGVSARKTDHRQENLEQQTSTRTYQTGVVDDNQRENDRATTPNEIFLHCRNRCFPVAKSLKTTIAQKAEYNRMEDSTSLYDPDDLGKNFFESWLPFDGNDDNVKLIERCTKCPHFKTLTNLSPTQKFRLLAKTKQP